MYSAHHGLIGATVTVASTTLIAGPAGLVLGLIAAFVLHDPTDRLGEGNYGNLNITLLLESFPFLLFLIVAYYYDCFWVALVGYIFGNGIDLIDKKLYLSVFMPSKYPATKHFRCHRRSPNVKLTKQQTILSIIPLLMLFWLVLFLKNL